MPIYLSYIKDAKRIRRERIVVGKSLLFDKAYYKGRYQLRYGVDAAAHFCAIGWKRGYNPSYFFDVNFYLDRYQDVRTAGMNPLVHYLTGGAQEFRLPTAEFDVNAFCNAHEAFDFRIHNAAELCIAHYGTYAWREERRPTLVLPDDVAKGFKARFDPEFYRSFNPDIGITTDAYAHFLWEGQYQDRDPAPDFDIHDYRRAIKDNQAPRSNPLFHYVREGRIQNFATQSAASVVLNPVESNFLSEIPTLCVHVHCFYPELLGEFIPGFANLPPTTTVVVTTVTAADADFVRRCLSRVNLPQTVEVRLVPNRGRDLGPFLVGCRDVWERFDLVLHTHTKVSPHVTWGDQWRRYLLDQTLGSRALVQSILQRFAIQPDLGCLYPRNFSRVRRYTDDEVNTATIQAVMDRLGATLGSAGSPDYPAGSVAWYRTRALSRLVGSIANLDAFEPENSQVDGTFAHALERVLPLSVRASGHQVLSYTTPRRTCLTPLSGFPERESSRASVPSRWYANTPRIARRKPLPLAPLSRIYDERALNIHWILPSFQKGAGGHMTIFRMVELLERFGHHQTVWLQNAVQFADQAEALTRIRQWYRPIGPRVHVRFLPEDVRQLAGDVLIATDTWTAYPAALTTNFKERFYFVQDNEPTFHPAGELRLTAEATYGFGFSALCAGDWLFGLMKERGSWVRSWDLCADHEVYYPCVPAARGDRPLRIAFYARAYTPRRAVTLGFSAFENLHRRGVPFHVELFGEAGLTIDFDFPHTQQGILTPEQLSELYRTCDLGVVFSATNYSLIPLEMMACGLPVVELDGPSTRAIFKDDEVMFANPTPYGVADAMIALMADPDRQARQRERAYAFVNRTSWERSARAVESALLERLRELGYHALTPEEFNLQRSTKSDLPSPRPTKQRHATVFIPTYNAGPGFSRVLDQVTQQVCDFDYDVFIIDSASSDGTVDLARRYADRGVRVEQVPKEDFQHGRTRNLGIALSDGAYVAVLTQDALPRDPHWLKALIGGFARGPKIAGVIGRHEAYPEHDAFTHRDMTEMFDGLALLSDVIDRDVGLPSYIYPGGQSWRMMMHFYSDNNSAMSRQAWKILPYPEIDWGEDQVWADEMIRLGFQKSYVNEAAVYHSHNFDTRKQYEVSVTEGHFWAVHFGINLHPDPHGAIAAMDARDRAFALSSGIDAGVLRQRLLHNRAVVEGRKAGHRLSTTLAD